MTRRRAATSPGGNRSPLLARRRAITEDDVRKAAVRFAKELGGYHKRMHFGAGAATGWPDDLFLFTPKKFHDDAGYYLHTISPCCWIEFKRPGKAATPRQLLIHAEMREYGQHVYVCDNIDSARIALAQTLEGSGDGRTAWRGPALH